MSLQKNKIRVVIVEDDFISAEFLKEVLEHNDAEVIDIVDNGKEAISTCIEVKPDVIFMDVMLNDRISGCEAAVAISKQSDAKIIFLTAYIDPEMVEYAVESHAAAYLTKPYNESQIIATMKLATTKHFNIIEEVVETPQEIYLEDGYVFNTHTKRLLKDKKEIELGPKPLLLVELLCSQVNVSISHEQISMHIWGEVVNDRTLRSLLFRVRSSTCEQFIKNISGVGYMVRAKQ